MSVTAAINSSNGNVDVSQYLVVEKGAGMEPGDPTFTEKIFARSLLKAGATLALEHLREKELVFPLLLSVPQTALVNLALDPNFEYDTVGVKPLTSLWSSLYSNVPATIEVTESTPFQGSKCLALTTNAKLANEGIGTGCKVNPKIGEQFTATVYLRGAVGGEKLQLILGTGSGPVASSVITVTNQWAAYKLTFTLTVAEQEISGNVYFAVRTAGTETEAWFIDTVIITKGSTPTAYFDGDTAGYKWTGTPGQSTSETKFAGKTGLANLIQEINLIVNTPGAQVEWQDEGATQPTFYDLISGQLDDEFDYRLSEKNGLRVKLRLFTQPLGYVSKQGPRALGVGGIATTVKVGTTPIITFTASGQIDGDAPALIQTQIQTANKVPYLYMGVSLLPSASYIPWNPINKLNTFQATLSNGASVTFQSSATAPGGTFGHFPNLRVGIPTESFAKFLPMENLMFAGLAEGAMKYLYVGDHRVLLVCRTPAGAERVGVQQCIHFSDGYMASSMAGPVATVPATNEPWGIVDLGVMSRASSGFYGGEVAGTEVRAVPGASGGGFGFNASAAIDIAGVIILPDDTTCWVNAGTLNSKGEAQEVSLQEGQTPIVFDGLSNTIRAGGSMGVPASGIAPHAEKGAFDITSLSRGAMPQVPAAASPPTIAVLAMAAMGNSKTRNEEVTVAINILERTRYVF